MSTPQTTLIIGGTSGMGRATAELLAARGDTVIIAGRNTERAAAVAGEVAGNVRGIAIDLKDQDSIEAAAAEIGAIDHLVLSAAALTYAPFQELTIDQAREVFDNKFWGYYRATRVFGPLLPATGSITIFSGVAVNRPGVGTVAVTAVNSALEGLTRSLAVELAPVRVNAVSPGMVDTEGWSHLGDERQASLDAAGAALLVGRIGLPADVASTVVHLIDNGYTTGTTHHVDGGARLV
jgi:NAD(P)-dependent dehydrogenase (short-subunit alcohol dehydrogenase family)